MSIVSVPFVFSAGAVIIASQHNSNFSMIFNDYNGNIDNNNISGTAAIAYTKLNLAGSIVNADINASAAIAASKLDLTSPGTIGNSTPNTGTFTTLKVGTTHQGDVLYDNGTSLVRLTPGTVGQALLTGGTAANPSWGPSSGISLISNTTITTANNTGDIAINNTSFYIVKMFVTSYSAGDQFLLRFNNDTGANYSYVLRGFDLDATPTARNGNAASGATSIKLNSVNFFHTASYPSAVELRIYPSSNLNNLFVKGEYFGVNDSTTVPFFQDISGQWGPSGAATSFRILTSGGATFSGNVYLYKYSLS